MKARYFAIAASALLVAACGGNAEDTEAAADSAMAPAPAPIEAPAMDSTAMPPMDSTTMAAPVDSTMAAPATDSTVQ